MRLLNPGPSLATTRRVLQQLRHDPRTVGLLLAVPSVLLVLLHAVLAHRRATFQLVGPPLLGIFPLISMFLVTSIAMLRERTTGTLERLLTMPVSKLDLLVGYGLAFALVAVVQAAVVGGVGFGLLGLVAPHGVALVMSLAIANALVGTSMGLFLSAFARTEFQAVQFLPAFVFPQLLLCGLVVPRGQMARWLQVPSRVLPLTYSYDALVNAARPAPLDSGETADVIVLVALIIASLTLGAVTLRLNAATSPLFPIGNSGRTQAWTSTQAALCSCLAVRARRHCVSSRRVDPEQHQDDAKPPYAGDRGRRNTERY